MNDTNQLRSIELRKEIKVLMIDLNLEYGHQDDLARELGASQQSLSMALTGHRTFPSSIALLERLKEHLETLKLDSATDPCAQAADSPN